MSKDFQLHPDLASTFAWTIQTHEHGPDPKELTLALPALGDVHGRLICPEGFDYQTLSVIPRPAGISQAEQVLSGHFMNPPAVDAKGEFHLKGLPAGELIPHGVPNMGQSQVLQPFFHARAPLRLAQAGLLQQT